MFDIALKTVLPKNGESHIEQLENCLNQIERLLKKDGLSKEYILKQSVFINSNNKSFQLIKYELNEFINGFFKENIPSTGFIGQLPLDGNKVAIEYMFLKEKKKETEIDLKIHKKFRYSVLKSNGIKTIYSSGLTSEKNNLGILEQTKEVFDLMKEILFIEGMDFSNIIRQWNYIESITGFDPDNKEFQNYQIFNDIRAEFYKKNEFINGYPAATGIGMNAGGLVIEFIAAEFSKNIEIIPISSPMQCDAHKYSNEVLIGDSISGCSYLSSPKFERAKVVQSNKKGIVFVSGTAAISGQTTIIDADIERQTLNTINNIKKLISNENLKNSGIECKQSYFSNIRVYIKNYTDIIEVKNIFKKEFKDIDVLYLISDICRENLLVEIEAILHF